MGSINYLVSKILQNIFFCVKQKKEFHTGFKQLEGKQWQKIWVNYPFNIAVAVCIYFLFRGWYELLPRVTLTFTWTCFAPRDEWHFQSPFSSWGMEHLGTLALCITMTHFRIILLAHCQLGHHWSLLCQLGTLGSTDAH